MPRREALKSAGARDILAERVSEDEIARAKAREAFFLDSSGGRAKGLKQFLDDKSFKPGLGAIGPSVRPTEATGGSVPIERGESVVSDQ